MSLLDRAKNWRVVAAVVVLACILAFLTGGQYGVIGMGSGIAGAAFNLWALAAVLRMGSKAAVNEQGSRLASFFIVLAFFIKLPVFIALGILCQRLGPPTLTCFLAGAALVYFSVVGSSLAHR